jgi:predicted phosphodiesterase
VFIWDAETRQRERVIFILPSGESVCFDAAGRPLQPLPEAVEKELVFVVESHNGRQENLTASQFNERLCEATPSGEPAELFPLAKADSSPDPAPSFSFGLIADVQYCDADAGANRYFRKATDRLAECVDDLNSQDLAFTIQLGDLIDRDFTSFDTVLPIYDRLKSKRYHVLGNHDFSVVDERKPEVPGRLGLQKRYYDFAVAGWRFLVLDGNEMSLYATLEGTELREQAQAMFDALKASGAAHAHNYNGGIGPEQLKWLKERLKAAKEASQKAVLFCHFPLFPDQPYNLWNRSQVLELLSSHDHVVAFIAGHNHAGEYGEKNGIHHVTLQGMVDTEDMTAYAVADVYQDRIEIRGTGRASSRTLKFPSGQSE